MKPENDCPKCKTPMERGITEYGQLCPNCLHYEDDPFWSMEGEFVLEDGTRCPNPRQNEVDRFIDGATTACASSEDPLTKDDIVRSIEVVREMSERFREQEESHRKALEEINCPTCGKFVKVASPSSIVVCSHLMQKIREIAEIIKDPKILPGAFPNRIDGITVLVED